MKNLYIGGVNVNELRETYGTPLYVIDEGLVRKTCQSFLNEFKHNDVQTEVIYASKAFLTKAMVKLIDEEGLSLDVVSGGELYTAFKANYPMEKVYFHGNNKSKEELLLAIELNVGTIIIDNPYEFELLESLLIDKKVNVLLRINPGIEAHTHEFIATTKNDSKFGLSIFDEATKSLIRLLHQSSKVNFLGFHSHIGSQIFEEQSFFEHVKAVLNYVKSLKDSEDITVKVINLGGGFGVKYVDEDAPIVDATFLSRLASYVGNYSDQLSINTPKVCIEPGRAIVANAGITLYSVGTTKKTYGGKHYVFVDGSMADHIRTALYDASYKAVLANRMDEAHNLDFTVTGKACESGDIIVKHAKLPLPKENDLLAVLSTGAYHYSMASNYNRLLKPAVVFCQNGESRLVVKRETYDDLLRNDL
ncbi:MAG: diaminopimelate decarboxylase [Candidatus Izemoplasmataceae bacterium]